jgi:hypothetical protein
VIVWDQYAGSFGSVKSTELDETIFRQNFLYWDSRKRICLWRCWGGIYFRGTFAARAIWINTVEAKALGFGCLLVVVGSTQQKANCKNEHNMEQQQT